MQHELMVVVVCCLIGWQSICAEQTTLSNGFGFSIDVPSEATIVPREGKDAPANVCFPWFRVGSVSVNFAKAPVPVRSANLSDAYAKYHQGSSFKNTKFTLLHAQKMMLKSRVTVIQARYSLPSEGHRLIRYYLLNEVGELVYVHVLVPEGESSQGVESLILNTLKPNSYPVVTPSKR